MSARHKHSVISLIVIGCIRVYQPVNFYLNQIVLSVFGVVSTCPQTPTCSEYTIAQVRAHGTIRGLRAGLIRVWNCRNIHSVT